jgi:hypothetical protein
VKNSHIPIAVLSLSFVKNSHTPTLLFLESDINTLKKTRYSRNNALVHLFARFMQFLGVIFSKRDCAFMYI